jgi:site-specific DNA recombinase
MIGIYCRVSRDRENQKSIKEQRLQGIAYADKVGKKYKIFIDEDISGGADIEDRPAFDEMLGDLSDGLIDSIWCDDQSRLERSGLTYQITIAYLTKHNATLIIGNKVMDVDDPDTRLMMTFLSGMNEHFRLVTSKKIKRVLVRNGQDGLAFAVNPYGYRTRKETHGSKVTKILEIDEDESKIVKQIFERSLSGIGTDSIAIELHENNTPTRKGGKWSGKQVQDILKNPIHKGLRRWGYDKNTKLWKHEFKIPELAIFEEAYYDKVIENLHTNRNSGEKQMKFDYLLKGLCKCAICGRNYYGRTRKAEVGEKPKDHYYMCSSKRKGQVNCGNRSIGIDKLEGLVWDTVISGTMADKILDFIEQTEKDDVRLKLLTELERKSKELEKIDSVRSRLIDLYTSEEISREEYINKNDVHKSRKEVLTAEIRRIEEQLGVVELRRQEIESDLDKERVLGISFNEKRELMLKYIDDIKILSDGVSHYVGVNVKNHPFPSVYYISVKGKVKELTVGWARKNKEMYAKLCSHSNSGVWSLEYSQLI